MTIECMLLKCKAQHFLGDILMLKTLCSFSYGCCLLSLGVGCTSSLILSGLDTNAYWLSGTNSLNINFTPIISYHLCSILLHFRLLALTELFRNPVHVRSASRSRIVLCRASNKDAVLNSYNRNQYWFGPVVESDYLCIWQKCLCMKTT